MGFAGNYLRNLLACARGAKPARPLLFSWYITHRCNLSCAYCCDGEGAPFKNDIVAELDTAGAKQLVAILRRSADTLDITGGEPLIRPDLEDILAHAKSIGFRTVLNTKGIGIERRPDLLRFIDVLVLSVDSLDPAELAQLIGGRPDVAEAILAAMAWAIQRCRAPGPRLVLAAVATATNLRAVAQLMRFAAAHGLGFQLSPHIIGTTVDPAVRNSIEYKAIVDEAICLKRRGRPILGVPQYLLGIRDFSRFRCHPLLMPTIRPDGRLYYPCLERKQATVDLLAAGSYEAALTQAQERSGPLPRCRDECHIFCHMALSMLQQHPLSALSELKALLA